MSFRYRLILSYILVETIFLALIVFVNFSSLQKSSDNLLNSYIETSNKLFNDLIKLPVSIYDLATLDDALQTLSTMKNISGVEVYDTSGVLLSSQ